MSNATKGLMRRLPLTILIAGLALAAVGVAPAGALAIAPPIVTTGAASAVANTTATVAGTVDPSGSATTYSFEYGTTTAYGQQSAPASAGADGAAKPVTAALIGLAPGTTYHFRITADNGGGPTPGTDATFTTTGAPTTGPVVAIAATTATLTGTVNPAGTATTYAFQYGTTTAYGQSTAAQSAGAGSADVPVSAGLTGLSAATTYHYRVSETRGAATLLGADQTFITAGAATASVLAVAVNPAGGNNDLTTTLNIGSDPAGNPVGQAAAIGQALSSQFASQLASFGNCTAAKLNNAAGPTAANCPDRTSILGVASLVTRDQNGLQAATDQGFVVKTADNKVVLWWHYAAGAFGVAPGAVTQETGLYGPVVAYDFTGLPAGSRVKQLVTTYQKNAVNGKAPFAATTCTGGSWQFQDRIVYVGGVNPELPTTTVACGAAPLPKAPEPSKLRLARATIDKSARVIDILAPITTRASGNVNLDLYAAGQHFKWTAPIDSADGRIRDRHSIPATQANKGTGILTISYPGDADTRPQVVRLRAANRPAVLDAVRPTLTNGHLVDHGTISSSARGVVRVQLEYYAAGKTTTLQLYATVANGSWSLNQALTPVQLAAINARQGTVESYILFTGYLPQLMRGEMTSYQVLGNP